MKNNNKITADTQHHTYSAVTATTVSTATTQTIPDYDIAQKWFYKGGVESIAESSSSSSKRNALQVQLKYDSIDGTINKEKKHEQALAPSSLAALENMSHQRNRVRIFSTRDMRSLPTEISQSYDTASAAAAQKKTVPRISPRKRLPLLLLVQPPPPPQQQSQSQQQQPQQFHQQQHQQQQQPLSNNNQQVNEVYPIRKLRDTRIIGSGQQGKQNVASPITEEIRSMSTLAAHSPASTNTSIPPTTSLVNLNRVYKVIKRNTDSSPQLLRSELTTSASTPQEMVTVLPFIEDKQLTEKRKQSLQSRSPDITEMKRKSEQRVAYFQGASVGINLSNRGGDHSRSPAIAKPSMMGLPSLNSVRCSIVKQSIYEQSTSDDVFRETNDAHIFDAPAQIKSIDRHIRLSGKIVAAVKEISINKERAKALFGQGKAKSNIEPTIPRARRVKNLNADGNVSETLLVQGQSQQTKSDTVAVAAHSTATAIEEPGNLNKPIIVNASSHGKVQQGDKNNGSRQTPGIIVATTVTPTIATPLPGIIHRTHLQVQPFVSSKKSPEVVNVVPSKRIDGTYTAQEMVVMVEQKHPPIDKSDTGLFLDGSSREFMELQRYYDKKYLAGDNHNSNNKAGIGASNANKKTVSKNQLNTPAPTPLQITLPVSVAPSADNVTTANTAAVDGLDDFLKGIECKEAESSDEEDYTIPVLKAKREVADMKYVVTSTKVPDEIEPWSMPSCRLTESNFYPNPFKEQ